jgi:hypothetical protein
MAEITDRDLGLALAQLSMLRYFPSGESSEMAQEAIVGLLRRLCGTREQLAWLVSEMVNHVGTWPGPAEVRGLFCSRYKPADGIEADCSLPGYSPADGEVKSQRGAVGVLPQGEAVKLLESIK